MARPGVLAMTLVVRDEEDILETNLRYHLAQGVDFVYAIDHSSTDGTPDILRGFEQMGVLRMFREDGDVHDQAPRVTRLARLAHYELGADWVINNDADEFWWPALGDLKDVLSAVPAEFGVLIARRHDFLPRPDGPQPFHERMCWRHAVSRTPTGGSLGPKATHRALPDVVVAPGNHYLIAPVLTHAPPLPLLEVLHFPARSYAQFARKTLNTGRGYELLPGRGSGTGIDQLELLRLLRDGALSDYYGEWALSPAELDQGLADGTIVHDVRLRDFLSAGGRGGPGPYDRRQVHDLVGAALTLEVERAAAAAALQALDRDNAQAQARARELEASLAAAALERDHARDRAASRDAELEALERALETVRNSRLMRSTRRLRRIYYKLK